MVSCAVKLMTDNLRRAEPTDAAEIVTCIDAAYAPWFAAGLQLPDVSGGVEQDIRENLVWVIGHDDRITGCLIAAAGEKAWHLMNVAVHPEFAGQGLGKRLIATCVDAAKHAGAEQLLLATHAEMPANVALYSRLGWVITEKTETRIRMSRTLSRE